MSNSPDAGTALLVARHSFLRQGDGTAIVIRAWYDALRMLGYRVTVLGFDYRNYRWSDADRFSLARDGSVLITVDVGGTRGRGAWRRAAALLLPLATGNRYVPQWLLGGRALRHCLEALRGSSDFDLIVVNGTDTLHMLGMHRLRGVCILDIHDLTAPRILQLQRSLLSMVRSRVAGRGGVFRLAEIGQALAWPSWRRLTQGEARVAQSADIVCCASSEELASLAAWGVDPARLRHVRWPIATSATVHRSRSAVVYDFGFLASDATFNVEGALFFLHQVLPLIHADRPGVSVCFAGSVCHHLNLGSLPEGVTLLGRIGNVAEFYDGVGIVIVPLLSGTGVSIKVMEAAAFGSPIISTLVGLRGLALVEDQDVLVGRTEGVFAKHCLSLLDDPAKALALGRAAQKSMRLHHDPATFRDRVVALAEEARHNSPRRYPADGGF